MPHSSNGGTGGNTVIAVTEQSVRHIDPKFKIVASSKEQKRETILPQIDLTDHSRHDFINSWEFNINTTDIITCLFLS